MTATEATIQEIFTQQDQDFPDADVLLNKVHNQMGYFALKIITEAGFGEPMSWNQVSGRNATNSTMDLQRSLTTMTEGQNLLFKLVLPKFLFWLPISRLKLVDSAFKGFERSMRERITQRLAEQEKGEEKADLFDALVSSMKDPDGFTDAELLGSVPKRWSGDYTDIQPSNIFTFLLAGHETTANILSVTLVMLALHPEEQEKVYQREFHLESDAYLLKRAQM